MSLEKVQIASYSELDDVRKAIARDIDAFERFYRVHLPQVYRTARWLIGRNEVDDVIRDSFICLWDKLELFDGRSSLATSLNRLAVNVILRQRERNTRDGSREVELGDFDYESNDAPTWLRMDVESAVSSLPKRAREVFVLSQIEGYSHDEIAEMIEMSPATSRAHLHRARLLLRKKLEGREDES